MKKYIWDSVILVSTRNKMNCDNNYTHHYASTKQTYQQNICYLKSSNVESNHTSFSDWRSICNNTM
jgi:hypothetical protein